MPSLAMLLGDRGEVGEVGCVCGNCSRLGLWQNLEELVCASFAPCLQGSGVQQGLMAPPIPPSPCPQDRCLLNPMGPALPGSPSSQLVSTSVQCCTYRRHSSSSQVQV